MYKAEEQNIEILLRQLKESQDSELRVKAAEKLGGKKEFLDAIIPALITALNDENLFVRVEAASSLSRIGRSALSSLETLRTIMNEPRNRTKRGSFYEFIHKLEEISKTEPEVPTRIIQPVDKPSEITPLEAEEETKLHDELEPSLESSTEEEIFVDEEKEEEIIDEDYEEELELTEEVATISEPLTEPLINGLEEEQVEEVIEIDEAATEKLQDELQDLEEKIEETVFESEAKQESSEYLEEEEEKIDEDRGVEIQIEEAIKEDLDLEEGEETITEEKIEEKIVEIKEELEISEDEVMEEEEEEEAHTLDSIVTSKESEIEEISTKKISKTLLKVIIAGDEGVGKTTIRKLVSDDSHKSEYKEAIGVDFSSKEMIKEGEEFILQYWDITGKDRLIVIKDLFFRGVTGALLVFDLSRRESFDNIRSWFREIIQVEGNESAFILIGNKSDLREEEGISYVNSEEGQELANELSLECGHEIPYFEINALTGENIQEVMDSFTELILSTYRKRIETQ